MKLERAFYLHTAPEGCRKEEGRQLFLCLFWFFFCRERKEEKGFVLGSGGRSFVLFLFNANEKEEKSQGGCTRQVQVFHFSGEKITFGWKIPQDKLKWPWSCRCWLQAGQSPWARDTPGVLWARAAPSAAAGFVSCGLGRALRYIPVTHQPVSGVAFVKSYCCCSFPGL